MAVIPAQLFNSVVALGYRTASFSSDGPVPTTQWVATGFLYNYRFESPGQDAHPGMNTLVTNRHVVDSLLRKGKGLEDQVARFHSARRGAFQDIPLAEISNSWAPRWFAHPDPLVDLAVLPVDYPALRARERDINVIDSDAHCLNLAQMAEAGVTEGDMVHLMGFPLGLVGHSVNTPIVRLGCVARIRDALAEPRKAVNFLVDGQCFPGNSGGLVIRRPEAVALQGTLAAREVKVIGVIQGYLPHEEIAIGQQTGLARVSFQENSGLAVVHPMDLVAATARPCLESFAAHFGLGQGRR